jgi:N-acetylneuraminic acid mutarotase
VAKAPLPERKFGLHASVVASKIHVMGGESDEAASVPTGSHHVYDPTANTWTKAMDMPTPRGFFGTATAAGRIYVAGGSINMQEQDPGIGIVEIYDPETDGWHRGADLPTPRADLTMSAVNGKLYAIGGTRHVGIEALGTVEEYDPAADRWTRKADLPTPRLHLTSAVVDNKIYVFGGGPEWPVPLATTEMYDPVIDSWTKMADMPTERTGLWAAALADRIYVMGGLSWSNAALATVEEYDTRTDTWRKLPDMPTARFLLAAETVSPNVFAIGGAATDFSTQNAVEAFAP